MSSFSVERAVAGVVLLGGEGQQLCVCRHVLRNNEGFVGGSQSDLKWGRDPEEDEIESARRCAREASHRLGIKKKSGMKRK